MQEVCHVNELNPEDVSSVFLTMTKDLNADFPAKAVRSMPGWQWVPLMCATEVEVPDAMKLCIRVLLHVNTTRSQKDMGHVYLEEAVKLRPDVVETYETSNLTCAVDETPDATYDEKQKLRR